MVKSSRKDILLNGIDFLRGYFCIGKCGKSKKADIVIAIDASVSFGAENLRQAKDFARNFIE